MSRNITTPSSPTTLPTRTETGSKASTPASPVSVWAVRCAACELVGHLFTAPAAPGLVEALAGTHNDLHHAGWQVARPVELDAVCESCQHAPAVLGLELGPGVAPFSVCTSCAPPDAFQAMLGGLAAGDGSVHS